MNIKSFFHICLMSLGLQMAWAQTRPVVNASVASINFGDCTAGTTCTRTFTLTNPQTQAITVEKLSVYASVFTASPAVPFTISASGSQTVTVSFSSSNNLTYKDVLTAEVTNGLEVTEVSLQARAVYNEDYGSHTDYYLGTEDLWGEALKTQLNSIISNNTNNDYTTSRNYMYGTTIDATDNGNGTKTLTCIYTGRQATMSTSTLRPSASSPEYINTEHTWPQSMFGGADPMVSDVHHLFPTDVDANAERGNFPFGNVDRTNASTRCHDTDIPTQDGNCTNEGSGTWSYLLNSVYEPRDVQKGNTARAMFYFITRYGDLGSFWSTSEETAFRQWHASDPPDAKEKARNTGIMNYQNNRNPYVDHPEFIDRISSFASTATGQPATTTPNAVPTSENYGQIGYTETLSAEIDVINRGNTAFTYTTSLSGSAYSITSGATGSVSAYGVTPIRVRFSPSGAATYTGTLTITPSSGSPITVSLTGMGASTPTLPVELVEITAQTEHDVAVLHWQTASEVNMDVFEVQSLVAGQWETIRTVKATGDALSGQTYTEVFPNLPVGTYTFRLKKVELDGAYAFSKPVTFTVEVPGAYILNPAYPNPFNPQTTITFAVAQKQTVTLTLYNTLGQRVQTLYRGTVEGNNLQTVRVDGSTLQTGAYFVRLIGENFATSQKLMLVK